MTDDEIWDEDVPPNPKGPCAHQCERLTVRIIRNGSKQYVRQCTTCGEPTSQAIAKSKIEPAELLSLPPFDNELREKFSQHQQMANLLEIGSQQIEHTQKYRDYLQTPEWRAKRLLVLQRDKHQCQGCRAAPATQVHHLTYAHVFNELLFELVSLCVPCHKICHPEKQ